MKKYLNLVGLGKDKDFCLLLFNTVISNNHVICHNVECKASNFNNEEPKLLIISGIVSDYTYELQIDRMGNFFLKSLLESVIVVNYDSKEMIVTMLKSCKYWKNYWEDFDKIVLISKLQDARWYIENFNNSPRKLKKVYDKIFILENDIEEIKENEEN
jgi:hypothetical protein